MTAARKNLRPLRILVVEDNEDDVLLLREAFAEVKQVEILHVARDGDEALAYLRREGPHASAPRPALILLDINMPRRNGLEVLAAIKADPRLRVIPVVMLTTSCRDGDVAEAYHQGASSYIAKPMDFEQLRIIVRHFTQYWIRTVPIPERQEP